jgi:hypothetical protein
MAWALCNMEQQSRSNATNATNHQATEKTSTADKTSSIKPVHLLGLLDLNRGAPSPYLFGLLDINRGAPSPSLSPFSTPSVAESVEFTETNPEALHGLGLGIDAIEQKASGNMGINDTESEGEGEELSAGGASSVQLKQVCLLSKSCVLKISFSKSCGFENLYQRSIDATLVQIFEKLRFQIHFFEQEAPGDNCMPDAEGESQIEEISTGGVVFNALQQV